VTGGQTSAAGANSLAKNELQNQDRHWSRHAARYRDLFVDPYESNVETPLWDALAAVPDAATKTVADFGCGTGPLLPYLAQRFNHVIALDFAPGMLKLAAVRLDPDTQARVTFLKRPMHELDDLVGQLDVAVAVNSLVMPDVRLIDRTLGSIRASLKPGGLFLGVVPSIDTICYHLSLLMDHALEQGLEPKEAKRLAALQTERRHYDFAFGEFHFDGLRQKFWQPFEIEYRLNKAGFSSTILGKVLYPWDESVAGSDTLAGFPRNWDWFFQARA
jgi:SAM-dependent methyltransferase